jgi:hypothetical protein
MSRANTRKQNNVARGDVSERCTMYSCPSSTASEVCDRYEAIVGVAGSPEQ